MHLCTQIKSGIPHPFVAEISMLHNVCTLEVAITSTKHKRQNKGDEWSGFASPDEEGKDYRPGKIRVCAIYHRCSLLIGNNKTVTLKNMVKCCLYIQLNITWLKYYRYGVKL